jgi:thiol:disulfide interchange protein DsbD
LVQGPVAAFVLSGDVLLPFTATGVTGSKISASARWLVCRDICVPEHGAFVLGLRGGASAEAGLFAAPAVVASPFAARISPDGVLSVAGLTAAQVAAARFFPDAPGAIVNRAAQSLGFTSDGLALRLTTAPGFDPRATLTGVLELTDPAGNMQAIRVSAMPGKAAGGPSYAAWLGLAFLGGLILNLMPCVFPILAMKAVAFARLGGRGREAVRREAVGYTAGVLTAMLLLAAILLVFREFGQAAGWGFQFQSPVFVALVGWLIFAAGLSLAGWFEISGFAGIGGRLAAQNSFFTGLLAVAVASPCTAPFMGAAVAAALAAPPAGALGIFLLLGLGLAAPFLLLGVVPHLAGWLPRPGRWMIVLERVLSLPMFATFLWLAWVLEREAGMDGVALLMVGAGMLLVATGRRGLRPVALGALLLLPLLRSVHAAPLTLPGAAPYSAGALTALRAAGDPVFVDMTASWCVTCLVNDRTTLATNAVRAGFAARGVKVLVGDWTGRDARISAFLQANGRDGVPLYVFYPAGGGAEVLPQVLTPGVVLRAVGER